MVFAALRLDAAILSQRIRCLMGWDLDWVVWQPRREEIDQPQGLWLMRGEDHRDKE
jgi:hypothetical protein